MSGLTVRASKPFALSALSHPWSQLLWDGLVLPALAVGSGLVVGGIILQLAGYQALPAFSAMFTGAFGTVLSLSTTLLRATPLILAGLGMAIAFRCSMWNIGAEGQLYAGAIAATFVGVRLEGWPPLLAVPTVLLAAFAAGACWGFIPGILRVRLGASEVVTSIMLNYVGIYLTSYLVTGPMREPGGTFPQSSPLAAAARLPRVVRDVLAPILNGLGFDVQLPNLRLHIGILIAIGTAIILHFLLFRTTLGYQIRAVGYNPVAARHAGISQGRTVVLAMLISGGMAGLAGGIEITGPINRLLQGFSPGYGYEAIAVALMAHNTPLGILLSGLVFGALRSGAEFMQLRASIPVVLVFMIQGLVILFIMGYAARRLLRTGG
ncbi:MAG: ABC transporter permease [Deinococcus sp.]|nr:ABC transporter permease [Deinococcus sp.]